MIPFLARQVEKLHAFGTLARFHVRRRSWHVTTLARMSRELASSRSTAQVYESKQQNKMASKLAARFLRKRSGFSNVLRQQVDVILLPLTTSFNIYLISFSIKIDR